MKLMHICKEEGTVTIELTCDELGGLHNALLESLEALDSIELPTRMGITVEEVENLLKETGEVYKMACKDYV